MNNSQEHTSVFSEGQGAPKRSGGNMWNMFIFSVLVFVVGGLIGYAWAATNSDSGIPMAPADRWQSVFLTNGQVYFGHLKVLSDEYLALTDIYYLQVQQAVQPQPEGQPAQPDISLVKLGGELHGPEDIMYLPKDRILFWENMTAESRVVQAIEESRQ